VVVVVVVVDAVEVAGSEVAAVSTPATSVVVMTSL
jgi:hypothetical protein